MRLIDADALKESLLETFDKAVEWYQETKLERAEQAVVTFAECLLRLKEQPTAEPKTGYWIPQDWNEKNGTSTTLVYCLPKCSVCGYSAIQTNYCPNCGAIMEGEGNGDGQ